MLVVNATTIDMSTTHYPSNYQEPAATWPALPHDDAATTQRDVAGDRLSSNSIALMDQAVVSGANFLTSVLVGRWCGLAELGAFALGCTVLVYALALQESFIASPYVVFVH